MMKNEEKTDFKNVYGDSKNTNKEDGMVNVDLNDVLSKNPIEKEIKTKQKLKCGTIFFVVLAVSSVFTLYVYFQNFSLKVSNDDSEDMQMIYNIYKKEINKCMSTLFYDDCCLNIPPIRIIFPETCNVNNVINILIQYKKQFKHSFEKREVSMRNDKLHQNNKGNEDMQYKSIENNNRIALPNGKAKEYFEANTKIKEEKINVKNANVVFILNDTKVDTFHIIGNDLTDFILNNLTENNDVPLKSKHQEETDFQRRISTQEFQNSKDKMQEFSTVNEAVQTSQQIQIQCLPYNQQVSNVPIIQQPVGYTVPKFTQLIQVPMSTVPKTSFFINPSQYNYLSYPSNFGTPINNQITPYSGIYPQMGSIVSDTNGLQVIGSPGKYFICTPTSDPSNNIANIPGVEIRKGRVGSNLQEMIGNKFSNKNSSLRITESSDCPFGERMCVDGTRCIKMHQICDGDVHCNDASDEEFCSCKERIGRDRKCDGYFDCPNGEDETGCFGCPKDYINCDDWTEEERIATCVPIQQKCDGIPHCPTGKDEADCIILTEKISVQELYKISNSVGFLHKNYKGKWYPVCSNGKSWAKQVCDSESGRSELPPIIHSLKINTVYRGPYINLLENNLVEITNTCDDTAIYVQCPQPTCGFRKIINNPFRSNEIDTSDEDILSRFSARIKSNVNESVGNTRVVGGKPSQPGAWPWVVSIYRNGIFHCGGAIISPSWILTAAHCVDKYWIYYYEIEAGILRRFSYCPMQQTRYADSIVVHADYDRSNLKNDLAIIKLSEPLKYNKFIRPVCLPGEMTAGENFKRNPIPGTICTAVGWGAVVEHGIDPDNLREVEVPVLKNCKHKEDRMGDELCAGLLQGGKDACQGDSGGPFLCKNPNFPEQWYLAGIVSHGEGCARPNEPGVYTRVSKYIEWIYFNIKSDITPSKFPLHKCPGYTCSLTNKCVPKRRRCDKIVDCLAGDDELNCREMLFNTIFKQAVENIFVGAVQGNLSTSLTEHNEENEGHSNKNSSTASAIEKINSNFTEYKSFVCKKMLQVIPGEFQCNRIADCEDATDEDNCVCADYLTKISSQLICDGFTDCYDLSDEKYCGSCGSLQFYCSRSKKCIPISNRCDGGKDCQYEEDEQNCFILSDGNKVEIDEDFRPIIKTEGIITVNKNGSWAPLCANWTSREPTIATDLCLSMGFSEYKNFLQTYITSRDLGISIKGINSPVSTRNATGNETCAALYVKCSSEHVHLTWHKMQIFENEKDNDFSISPWNAAIYIDGSYKCSGVLLSSNYILASSRHLKTLRLNQEYVIALLGSSRIHLSVGGPHEQVIRVLESTEVSNSDAVLLRLEKPIEFTRYVQSLHITWDGKPQIYSEKCLGYSLNFDGRFKIFALKRDAACEEKDNCFRQLNKIENCNISTTKSSSDGYILCDSGKGLRPSAFFTIENNTCDITRYITEVDLMKVKSTIKMLDGKQLKTISPPLCSGFRCKLGNCLDKSKICDNIPDCKYAEDEELEFCRKQNIDCHLTGNCNCLKSELRCNNGKCIPKLKFCDSHDDCGDGSDEPINCSCKEYLALTNMTKICDGVINCLDRSDENPVICNCKTNQFECKRSGYCIPYEMVCDGHNDCGNNGDEENCFSLVSFNDNEFSGEVISQTSGVWHKGCFPKKLTTLQLENICKKLGFVGGSATQIFKQESNIDGPLGKPSTDVFDIVWIHRKYNSNLRLAMRNGDRKFVKFEKSPNCHRLFISCL